MNIHYLFYKWVNKYKEEQEDAFEGSGNLSPKSQADVEKDNRIRDLEEEVAILKKAMGIFAKNQK